MIHWSDLRPLAFAMPSVWFLSGAPLGYPIVLLCHEDAAVLDLWVPPFHMLQQLLVKSGWANL